MASKFIERHKRKSLWALLLLFLRGRGKYLALLVVIILFSLPFVATSDMVERFFGLSPIRYMVKLFGFESVMASINPKYSTDILKAVFDRLKDEYSRSHPLLRGSKEESREGIGTLAYVKVGDALKDRKLEYKEKDGKKKAQGGKEYPGGNEIDGVVDEREGKVDGVDLSDILGGGLLRNEGLLGNGGLLGSSGFYGLSRSDGLYGDGVFGGSRLARFSAKDLLASFSGKGGVGRRSIAEDALSLSQKGVPSVNSPTLKRGGVKVRRGESVTNLRGGVEVRRSGSVTAFGWRNVGYIKEGAGLSVNITGNRRALFQMGETMATTAMAYLQNPAYETQQAYIASTYDGLKIPQDMVVTSQEQDIGSIDTAYVSQVVDSAQELGEMAKRCQEAQSVHGTRIGSLQKQIDNILKTMTNPPSCCDHGAVAAWNNKVSTIIGLCNQLNTEAKALGEKCNNPNPQLSDCGGYANLYIKPCKCKKGFFGGFFGIILGAVLGGLLGFLLGGGLLWAAIGAAIGAAVGSVISGGNPLMALMSAIIGVAAAYTANWGGKLALSVMQKVMQKAAEKKK